MQLVRCRRGRWKVSADGVLWGRAGGTSLVATTEVNLFAYLIDWDGGTVVGGSRRV